MVWTSLSWILALGSLLVVIGYINSSKIKHRDRDMLRDQRAQDEAKARISRRRNQKQKRSEKPNIVFVLTDDQDIELGSMNFMPKTLKILQDGGATFTNAFVTTPMCCPSRSSMLTGMYVHNHNTYTNNDNCSSVQWQQTYETRNFGTYLSNAGYRTGYFGKYLNEYKGTYIPPGWSEWVGLIRNTRFYNYTLNFNGKKIKHYDNYYQDYLTDLIANDSVTFLKQSKQYFPNRPVAMVLSMPAPHGPEDAAPQYQHLFNNVTTHRTPSWNFAPNADKQWILQYVGKMEPIHIAFTDLLQRKRLQTLQSVDDAVEKIYTELKELGELDNTYLIFSSDHGYHLGQYGLLKGKAMPYEFDIKVPFYMRGPKIPSGIRVPNIVINVDIAPTMLDIAGVPVPDHMDGRSILKLFDGALEPGSIQGGVMKKKKAWRDTFLVERGKITNKKISMRERLEAKKNNLVVTKEQRLVEECSKAEYQAPCGPNQQWECRMDEAGKLRMFKCRHKKFRPNDAAPSHCNCPQAKFPDNYRMDRREKQLQRRFLKQYVSRPDKLKPKFIRNRRDTVISDDGTSNPSSQEGTFEEDKPAESIHVKDNYDPLSSLEDRDTDGPGGVDSSGPVQEQEGDTKKGKDSLWNYGSEAVACRVLANSSVVCDEDLYENPSDWKNQKERLDYMIQQFKLQLEKLKDVRKHLKAVRPTDYPVEEATDPLSPDGPDEFWAKFEELGEVLPAAELDGDCNCEQSLADEDFDLIMEQDEINSLEEHTSPRAKRRREKKEKRDRRKKKKERKRDRHEKKNGPDAVSPDGKKHPDVTKDCDSSNMKCFTHDNDHWKTPPLWNSNASPSEYEGGQGHVKYGARKDPMCHLEGLECSRMDNDHWKVAPRWTMGPFCFCPNSNNNTYWCLRTINETHNFLYCEFITGFISYYNMIKDPYQLRNAVLDLNYGVLQQLHVTLEKLKGCRGARECTIRARPPDDYSSSRKNHSSHNKELNGSGDADPDLESSGEEDPRKDEFLWLTDIFRLDRQQTPIHDGPPVH